VLGANRVARPRLAQSAESRESATGSVSAVDNPLRSVLRAAPKHQRAQAPARADDLAELTLQDLEGDDVRLGDVWRERPAVLVWLRHYG
jgi:hypothetical protein